jgi:hypothetical protein
MTTNTIELKQESQWQKTPVANLVRNTTPGIYYARVRTKGKLIWKSLEADWRCLSVPAGGTGGFHGLWLCRNQDGAKARGLDETAAEMVGTEGFEPPTFSV